MSIIESLQAYISTCPALNSFADLHVDGLEPGAVNYSIDTLPGARILSQDLAGNKTREFPFMLLSREASIDDITRIANTGFYEDFADWLEDQSDNDTLPDLGTKKIAESIEATSWGYLYQRDENDQTAIYQIICKMTYTQTKG
ncbi:hypothetical protein [Clostridium merdae]|uniref:hypothetical protein n=1 Tax=Clostridium merdae TaxID=1958780 RepID=UPI000A26B2BB|nr:hypothetical protein [Clostridium merdae]